MAYMLYAQYTAAVKQAYAGRADAAQHADRARACREWLESLEIEPKVRDSLVEQIKTLEEAFQDLARVPRG